MGITNNRRWMELELKSIHEESRASDIWSFLIAIKFKIQGHVTDHNQRWFLVMIWEINYLYRRGMCPSLEPPLA